MKSPSRFVRFIIREATVLTVITLAGGVLFLDAFPAIHDQWHPLLFAIDYACILFFVVEAYLKIRVHRFSGYWKSVWNRFDFLVVIASVPVLISPFGNADLAEFTVVLLLRLGRLLRFFRIVRFMPNAELIWRGVARSLRASVGIFLVLVLLIFILGMGANMLFGEIAPQFFGDPFISLYSIFKVFTVEGWYDIPESLAASGLDGSWLIYLRVYFIFTVLVGGILGLSLANAIFVDEMTADNTRLLEQEMAALRHWPGRNAPGQNLC